MTSWRLHAFTSVASTERSHGQFVSWGWPLLIKFYQHNQERLVDDSIYMQLGGLSMASWCRLAYIIATAPISPTSAGTTVPPATLGPLPPLIAALSLHRLSVHTGISCLGVGHELRNFTNTIRKVLLMTASTRSLPLQRDDSTDQIQVQGGQGPPTSTGGRAGWRRRLWRQRRQTRPTNTGHIKLRQVPRNN